MVVALMSTALLVAIVLFVAWYVSQERYIYYWDYANYQAIYKELGEKLLTNPLKAIDSINVSVRKSDYNNSGVVLLMPFYLLFGGGRLAFVLAISIIYAFSTLLFYALLIQRLAGCEPGIFRPRNAMSLALPVGGLVLLPQFWIPTLLGYIDVVGVGVIFIILYLYFHKPLADVNFRVLIGIGLLLSLLVVLRRWYAYWVLGFFAAAVVSQTVLWWRDRTLHTGVIAKNLAIVCITAIASFFAVSTQVAMRITNTDYRDLYSAYRTTDSLQQHLATLWSYFGLLTMAIVVCGAIMMAIDKRLQPVLLFLGVLFIVTFVSFTRTQSIDLHHYYWVISIFAISIGIFVVRAWATIKNAAGRIAFLFLFAGAGVANFSSVFIQAADRGFQPIGFALPSVRLFPRVRNDLEEIRALLTKLDEITKDRNGTVYILSSSTTLNSSIVKNSCRELGADLLQLEKRVLTTNDVDKRDGFPFQLYSADFLVVADPPGYHLDPNDQKVVVLLAERLLKGDGFGAAYERLPFEVGLDDGSNVYIYHRTRRFYQRELTAISDEFTSYYPDKPDKFKITAALLVELTE